MSIKTDFTFAGYQKVEYIQSSGTQYIDTGLRPNLTHSLKYEGSFNYSDTNTRQLNGLQGFRYIGVISGYYQITNESQTHTSIVATPNRFNEFMVKFTPSNNGLQYQIEGNSYNGTSFTQNGYNEDYANNGNISIFSLNGGLLPSSCKIKYWKIYVDDVLVRNFYPVYRKSDNVIGMLDIKNKVFYTNQGSGSFTKGPNIN